MSVLNFIASKIEIGISADGNAPSALLDIGLLSETILSLELKANAIKIGGGNKLQKTSQATVQAESVEIVSPAEFKGAFLSNEYEYPHAEDIGPIMANDTWYDQEDNAHSDHEGKYIRAKIDNPGQTAENWEASDVPPLGYHRAKNIWLKATPKSIMSAENPGIWIKNFKANLEVKEELKESGTSIITISGEEEVLHGSDFYEFIES